MQSEKIDFKELSQENLDEASAVLTRSFLQLNDIWKQFKPRFEEICPVIRGKILPSISSGWSFVMTRGNKVIAVSIEYELKDYLSMPSMPSSLPLFQALAEAGRELEAKVDFSGVKRGQAIYGLYGVIDPTESKKGLSLPFWWHLFTFGKVCGWYYYYSRISSPVSLKMLVNLGAQILAEAKVAATNEQLWMVRIDLRKPFPSMSYILSLRKKPKL